MRTMTEFISEVLDVLDGVESMSIRIDWLDWAIGEIHRARERHELVQNVNTLRLQAEEVRKQLDSIEHLINQVEEKMADQKMDSTSVKDHQIRIFKDPRGPG